MNTSPNGFYAGPPPMMNPPPPRIFGSGQFDPSQLPQNMFAQDDMDDHNDQGDPKRRRIARACDMCRKKKIKCDGKLPSCTHCQNYKTECIFTQVEKKRQPPKGAKYIEGLENRLARMESLMRLSGVLPDDDDGSTDLATIEKRLTDRAGQSTTPRQSTSEDRRQSALPQSGTSTTQGTPAQPTLPSPRSGTVSPEPESQPEGKGKEGDDALAEMMCSLVTNNYGETRYIGSSSGFSIFSPKGIQWVNEKTGDNSFQHMISTAAVEDNKWIQWRPDVFQDIFKRRVYKQLPPKHEALSLLKDYFENFNCMFPLFHEPTFMHLVDKHYSKDPYEGSGWWASLNVALAFAHRLRVMSNLVPAEEDEKAWQYLKNAMSVMVELTMRNTDLLSVQALLGIGLFLLGTPNPQPTYFFVATAMRLAHSIGLHKKGANFNLNNAEVEQRKRVFWIAYMLDKDICLRSGRPPIQDDDDMNVELPSEFPSDNIGNIPLADGKGTMNLFRLMCTFSIIQSKVYKGLYSVKASKQTDGELLNTIGELDRELENWKDGIALEFRPEHDIKASHTPLILQVAVLHLGYYNCLTTIHRMSVHHGYWTSRLSNFAIQGLNARPLNPRVFMSAQLCVQAARASIHLLKYIPKGDLSCVWLVIYFPVTALVTLFANILQNPQDTRSRSDHKLMKLVVNFLNMLNDEQGSGSVKRMCSVCAEFERIVAIVLDKTDREHASRRKRKQGDSEQDAQIEATAAELLSTRRNSHSQSSPNVAPSPQPQPPQQEGLIFNPDFHGFNEPFPFSPNFTHASLQANAPMRGYGSPGVTAQMLQQQGGLPMTTGADVNGINNNLNSIAMGQFDQTFNNVPQDLWKMPMTLEWDWADMTGYNGYEDGISMNGVMPDYAQTDHGTSQFNHNNMNGGSLKKEKTLAPVVLFGYESSPFTNKVRLALRIKGIPFHYVTVPSMMPRPLLKETFGLSYRKIPVLAIGREVYCDTSLIIEALEWYFPSSRGYGTVYPSVVFPSTSKTALTTSALSTSDSEIPDDGNQVLTRDWNQGWDYRPLARGFASFWTDKPLFRTTTGLIPHTVWESSFGTDRSQLIGHPLNAAKLKAKLPQNLGGLDLQLSLLEPLFRHASGEAPWVFPTRTPSLADLSLYYQLRWGVDIAAGRGVYNLTGGGAAETSNAHVTAPVWNASRYPGTWKWFHAFEAHIASLPDPETVVPPADFAWKTMLKQARLRGDEEMLVPASAPPNKGLDEQQGLKVGVRVSVAPDDTGRGNPTTGRLVGIGVEEVVVQPEEEGEVGIRVHFPRLGFVVKVVDGERARL
ncbi:fungal specific transcription factor domain-containing protein [Stagonosporopsis vannaccii]|nr:fungal specific transcription factor domain-containing protein [Stagonosporopsis vannaccii]